MPHSSGGGSHSGGSHSGSHSSHHSSGSSRHSINRRYTTTYFTGAHHYVYYRRKKPVQYYSEEKITPDLVELKRNIWKKTKLIFLCIYLVLLILICISSEVIHIPRKLKITSDLTTPIINDTTNIISDEDEEVLYETLGEFYNKTSIPVMIYTTSDKEWNNDFATLENFAYDKYITTFHDDESCWLIVYSEPDAKENGFVDWKWEGMQGDDTDCVLTTSITDKFTKDVQKQITNDEIGKALITSFSNLNNYVMKFSINPLMFIECSIGMIYIIGWFFLFAYFVLGAPVKRYESSIELEYPNLYKEDTCTYCGGLYVHGIHISCPHCGGQIQPLDDKVYIASPSQLRS